MIAVVIAIAEEVRDYLDEGGFKRARGESTNRFYESPQKPDVVVVEGGVGRDRAEMATGEVIERYSPELLISAGFAGAVKPGLRVGDLFVCDRVWSVDGDPAFWKPEAASTRKLVGDESKERLSGKIGGPVHELLFAGCLSVGVFVGSSSLKGWIGSNFPVSVIDMESFWVSQLAVEHGIPHVVLRSVLDPMEGDAASVRQQRRGQRVCPFLAAGGQIHGLQTVGGAPPAQSGSAGEDRQGLSLQSPDIGHLEPEMVSRAAGQPSVEARAYGTANRRGTDGEQARNRWRTGEEQITEAV